MSAEAWLDAALAAAVLAVDPGAVGGAVVRARSGPVRDRWCALLKELLPEGAPMRRVPAHVTEDRLLGGLDLAATLRAGRVVAERGLLADVDGGVVLVPMAERLKPTTAAHLFGALDRGEVVLERDGLARRSPSRFAVVALDEGIDDERVPRSLADRLGIHLDLDSVPPRLPPELDLPFEVDDTAEARRLLPSVTVPDAVVEALVGTAFALGIDSCRAPILAVAVARIHSALSGRTEVVEEDAAVAARLVLGPRATRVPAPPEEQPEDNQEEAPPEPPSDPEPAEDPGEIEPGQLDELILAAAKAALPPGLLERLAAGREGSRTPRSFGPAGALSASLLRGRPAGTRRGNPKSGGRLNVVETLRSAAPWQRVRGRVGSKVEVRQDDFRIARYKRRTETLTIFSVDASGSAALARLAEAKGAVELMLADCYVRRDSVALIGFRGAGAELLLPPTRSLARAKRSLAGLPGGGTTPLAHGIDAARELAEDARRRGKTPVVVLMTDARGNVARDGSQGRARAEQDALAAARALATAGIRALFLDTAPRPRPPAKAIADAMGALYLALPRTDGATLTRTVRAAADAPAPR